MTTDDPADLLRAMRVTLTNLQGQLTDAINIIEGQPQAPKPRCPYCGVVTKGTRSLDEHIYNSHAGPVPAHYDIAEARTTTP